MNESSVEFTIEQQRTLFMIENSPIAQCGYGRHSLRTNGSWLFGMRCGDPDQWLQSELVMKAASPHM